MKPKDKSFTLLLCAFVIFISSIILALYQPQPNFTKSDYLDDSGLSSNNEKYLTYIKAAYQEDGQAYLVVDYVDWLNDIQDNQTTLAASKACFEDKNCAGSWCADSLKEGKSCMPNGFYIRNKFNNHHEFKLSPTAEITVFTDGGPEHTAKSDVDIFVNSYNRDVLYLIKEADGVVNSITQVFTP